jgi:hypothetical protein
MVPPWKWPTPNSSRQVQITFVPGTGWTAAARLVAGPVVGLAGSMLAATAASISAVRFSTTRSSGQASPKQARRCRANCWRPTGSSSGGSVSVFPGYRSTLTLVSCRHQSSPSGRGAPRTGSCGSTVNSGPPPGGVLIGTQSCELRAWVNRMVA